MPERGSEPLFKRPNPGSAEAKRQGCTCPVLDNNHGRSAPWPPDGWWIVEGCPVHHLPEVPEEYPERTNEHGNVIDYGCAGD